MRGAVDTERDYQGFDAEIAQTYGFVRGLGEAEVQRPESRGHENVYLCTKGPENT